MTPEQLDEIEKDALETDWQPDFRDALKLVKAVRERDEHHFKVLEQYRLEVEDYKRRTGDLLDQLAKEEADVHQFQKERDAARAEVEMLRGVGCGELREGAEVPDGPCGVCLGCARRERDEAREARDAAGHAAAELMKLLMKVEQERDEVRVEIDLLRAEVRKQVFGSRVVFDREVVERAEAAPGAASKESE